MSKTLTNTQFINKAREVHGDKYDYSLVEYVNTNTKVKITCPEHGIFEQMPRNHTKGRGCQKCANRCMTTFEFIKRAQEVHGDKYDYSLVDSKNNKTKVKITCKEHGWFNQIPNAHLNNNGCPECARLSSGSTLVKSVEMFIEQSREVHGDKYDYSLVEYVNTNTKVKIICKEHGQFEQIPKLHTKNSGCTKCSRIRTGSKLSSSTAEFVEKAHKVHGDKYDYSKVEYVNTNTKVKIMCKKHGQFTQRVNDHLSGNGCTKCSRIRTAFKLSSSTAEFVEKAHKVHGDKYSYSKVEYKNNKTNVDILCKKHGSFFQTPNSHLGGSGCSMCFRTRVRTQKRSSILGSNHGVDFIHRYQLNSDKGLKPGVFYRLEFKHVSGFEFIKVGITSVGVKRRFKGKQYKDFSWKVLELVQCNNLQSAILERTYLNKLREFEYRVFQFPQSISFTGWSECFHTEIRELKAKELLHDFSRL